MNKKRKLLKIFLIPILIIGFVQGVLPFLILVWSGVRNSMEKNTIQMDSHTVENRQVVLENDMIEQWRPIYKESEMLSDALKNLLNDRDMEIDQFLGSKDAQLSYLENVFPELIDVVQYNSSSGIFLILANDKSVNSEASYNGFFVRDSDPQQKNSSYSDLLLERGSKKLSQTYSISLDSAWATEFSFAGNGNRASDDFFYKPYMAALNYSDEDTVNMGYWAKPFILEDQYVDNHSMITYSVPLEYDGTIYGVIGVEISVSYLTSYFSVKELDSDLNAGYAIMIGKGDNKYDAIAGKGALYEAVMRANDIVSFSQQNETDFYKVDNAKMGQQDIYAFIKPLSVYSGNVPYDDTDWVLCGFVTENSVYGMGRTVYERMLIAIFLDIVIATITIYLLIRYVTKPVYSLMESVRGGVEGIHEFKNSNILEIDELHDVVENLTDTQKQTEVQLLEEKERYRIAVESSQDMFFTFRRGDRILEIVNSKGNDGVWNCNEHPEFIDNENIYPDDRERLFNVIKNATRDVSIEFRFKLDANPEYTWVNLSASIMQDDNGKYDRIVGCVHNINQRKLLEEEQKNKQYYDTLTSFYRLNYGVEAIDKLKQEISDGVLIIIDVEDFTRIDEQYGLAFGDVIVEQLADLMVKQSEQSDLEKVIYIRAGADQLMMYMPFVDVIRARNITNMIKEKFGELTNEDYLQLRFKCGIAESSDEITVNDLVEHVKNALFIAKHKHEDVIIYDELSEEDRISGVDYSFREIAYFERIKQMSLSSLALNMFDKGGDINVILDILALKLKEQYNMENLVITRFDREYLVNGKVYDWKKCDNDEDDIVRLTENDYQAFMTECDMQIIKSVTENDMRSPAYGVFIDDTNCALFHMVDNGQYSGTIIFKGIKLELLYDDAERKRFDELGAIIQNRINLKTHDLSAQAKSDFLARMSHEIRTPMNGIIGMTEIALRDGQTEEKRVDCLKKIESSSNYLLGLLNDILDMSKIESGKMKIVEDRFNLSMLLNDLNPLLESKIADKNISFTSDIELIHDTFIGDELRLNQVLVNLLSNAVKYNLDGGNVKLTVKETDCGNGCSDIYFSVMDDGIGIAEDKQQLIFQSFEQADNSENARKQGTGLGLAISRRLIRMMKSDIEVESKLGEGSTFSFTIQLAYIDSDEDVIVDNDVKPDFSGKRILVVEDNALNMEIIHTILLDYGFEVDEAYNGQEAVTKMESSSPYYYDLVLMDIMMPVMNGLEATRAIRKLNRKDCATVPIVAMSANAFDDDVKLSLASGMVGHLSKPINVRKMEEMLINILIERKEQGER